MLHSDTIIRYLDVYNQAPVKNTLAYLFRSFSFKIRNNKIDFEDNDVLLQDFTGWTKLESISSHKLYDDFIIIKFKDMEVIASKDQQIPIWFPDKITKGFHGETKYDHKIISVKDITLKDNIRSRISDSNFIKPISIDTHYKYNENFYSIKTKSKYFTANEIYFYNDIL